MWPGFTTKLSEEILAAATTIFPKKDIVHVTDTTATTVLTTIMPAFGGGFSGMTIFVNRSGGNITTVTTGNIAKAVTIPESQSCVFVYSKLTDDWYPGAIS